MQQSEINSDAFSENLKSTDLDAENFLKKREKNKKKKLKKKNARVRKQEEKRNEQENIKIKKSVTESAKKNEDDDIEVVFVPEDDPEELLDPTFRQFRKVFQYFRLTEDGDVRGDGSKTGGLAGLGLRHGDSSEVSNSELSHLPLKARAALLAQQNRLEEDEELRIRKKEREEDLNDPTKMSKKKLKRLTRLSVAGLKQLVTRPDVVEMHDVCARDPKLLVHLKSYRNTVPVPRHWCAKRKYLQGKRGIEKSAFRLPEFIAQTGIIEMRQTVQDSDAEKSLKTKMREKIRPKVGRVDIDYNKLHDAFFKYQTKPKLSLHGDLYYEGKEFEVRLKEKKPGQLSEELKTALGMPPGPESDRFPPPWLIAMQRYGPPPSYPNLKIPGLNAPIPQGCSFGYHTGGWGKPPVDELGKPLYGDVFGYGTPAAAPSEAADSGIDTIDNEDDLLVGRKYWGELESDEEESEGEEESSEEEEENEQDIDADARGGLVTPATGLITPSGASSMMAGASSSIVGGSLSSIGGIDTVPGGDQTPQLYKILPEVQTQVQRNEIMGSSKVYDVTGKGAESADDVSGNTSAASKKRKRPGDASITSGTTSGKSTDGAGAAKKYKEFKF